MDHKMTDQQERALERSENFERVYASFQPQRVVAVSVATALTVIAMALFG